MVFKLIFTASEMRTAVTAIIIASTINSAEIITIIMDTASRPRCTRRSRSAMNKTRQWPLSVGCGGRRTIIVVAAGVSRTCCPRGVRSAFDSRGLRLTARVVRRRRPKHIYQFSAQKSSSLQPPQRCEVKGAYNDKKSLIKKNKIIIFYLNNIIVSKCLNSIQLSTENILLNFRNSVDMRCPYRCRPSQFRYLKYY